MLSLRGKVRRAVSRDPSCSPNGDLADAKKELYNDTIFFLSGSDSF